MRLLLLALAAMLLASPALAAPTCVDKFGDGIRCATPGAMPVGWTAPPAVSADRPDAQSAEPTASEVIGLACVIGGVFALIALMPDFDGRRGRDWGEQEGDGDEGEAT